MALAQQQQAGNCVATVSHEALSSRPHHGKYYAPHAAERLAQTFPGAKVLFIFREQSSIIYSLYGEHVRNGGQHSLAEFIGTGQEPPGWAPLCKMSFFEYDRLVEMYQRQFGADNVLALPLELLKADAAEFSRRLFAFAGLPDQLPDTEAKTNSGWGALTVELYRLTNGLIRRNPIGRVQTRRYKIRQYIAWRIDWVIPKRWNKAVERRRRAALEARLEGLFAPSNARLAKMLDIDLQALGFK